jgi:hypothetical protein
MNLEPTSELALFFRQEGNVTDEVVGEDLCEHCREKGASIPRRTEFVAFGATEEVSTTELEMGSESRFWAGGFSSSMFSAEVIWTTDIEMGSESCFWADKFSISSLRRPVALSFEKVSCDRPNHTIS